RISATIRTARSRSSGGYLLDEPPDMTPSFPRTGVSGHAGAVQGARVGRVEKPRRDRGDFPRQRGWPGPNQVLIPCPDRRRFGAVTAASPVDVMAVAAIRRLNARKECQKTLRGFMMVM
ncbi:hypothetical protein ACNJSN_19620, partial [Mycobacterium tuberculosis]